MTSHSIVFWQICWRAILFLIKKISAPLHTEYQILSAIFEKHLLQSLTFCMLNTNEFETEVLKQKLRGRVIFPLRGYPMKWMQ